MSDDNFRREVEPFLDHVIRLNGGIPDLSERSRAVPGTVTFIAGYVCGKDQGRSP